MIVIGIVGGIGSGKSRVASLLCDRGAVGIDADRIGHDVLGRGAVKKKLIRRWGRAIIGNDGQVLRREIARRAFSDPTELHALNRIVHPPLLAEIRRRLSRARREGCRAAVLDAALLLEFDLDRLTDLVIFVDTPHAVRLSRVSGHRGWDGEELTRRESHQIPLSTKAARADIIVNNHSSIDPVRRQVAHLWFIAGRSH